MIMSSVRAAKWNAPSSSCDERIAGEVPAVAHIGRLPVVGEIAAAGRPAHGEPAEVAARHLAHVLVDDARLVAGDRPAGGGRVPVAKAVADEDVQHLGGADAVEDRLAGLRDPVLEDGRRQRLAGRTASRSDDRSAPASMAAIMARYAVGAVKQIVAL